jgi:hypothetical protein
VFSCAESDCGVNQIKRQDARVRPQRLGHRHDAAIHVCAVLEQLLHHFACQLEPLCDLEVSRSRRPGSSKGMVIVAEIPQPPGPEQPPGPATPPDAPTTPPPSPPPAPEPGPGVPRPSPPEQPEPGAPDVPEPDPKGPETPEEPLKPEPQIPAE